MRTELGFSDNSGYGFQGKARANSNLRSIETPYFDDDREFDSQSVNSVKMA